MRKPPAITSVHNGHTLTFLENPWHVYKLDGRKIPGGTDVKKGYPPSRQLIRYYVKNGLEEFDSRKKLTQQADVGSAMHDYCHAMRLGLPFDKSQFNHHPDAAKIFKRFAEVDKWLLTVANDKVVSAEEIVAWVCPLHRHDNEKIPVTSAYCTCFGGKYDCLIERDGKYILQDYKSAKGHFADQYIQEGGYAIALEYWKGIKVEGFEVIRFNDNTPKPSPCLIDDPIALDDFKKQFLRCRSTRNFQHKWEEGFFKEKYEAENPYLKKWKGKQ